MRICAGMAADEADAYRDGQLWEAARDLEAVAAEVETVLRNPGDRLTLRMAVERWIAIWDTFDIYCFHRVRVRGTTMAHLLAPGVRPLPSWRSPTTCGQC